MGNLLHEYMQNRFEKEKVRKTIAPGPVISISREFGCPSRELAQKLLKTLSRRRHEWEFLSKEILDKAARELNIHTFELESAMESNVKGIAQDILNFLTSKYYPREKKIRTTYAEVIFDIASKGNVIIVGRASAMITKNIKKALHVKLRAPLNWRAKAYSSRHELSEEEAQKIAIDTDKNRAVFRENFQDNAPEYDFYDLIFNCESFSVDEMVELIIKAGKEKEVI